MRKATSTVSIMAILIGFVTLALNAWGAIENSTSDRVDRARSDQIWAKELISFVDEIGSVKVAHTKYESVPATTVEISGLHDCLDKDIAFVVHFLSTGRYVTQFKLPGKQMGESVRKVAKQLFGSDVGSAKELEAGRILRTQAYISRIVPLVEEDSKAKKIAKQQVQKIRNLCSTPSLVNEFLRKIKPRKDEAKDALKNVFYDSSIAASIRSIIERPGLGFISKV